MPARPRPNAKPPNLPLSLSTITDAADVPPNALVNASAKARASHYFLSSAPLEHRQGKPIAVSAAGADIVLRGGAGTFSKSELDEGTRLLLECFVAAEKFSVPGSPRWCDLGCGWGAVAAVLATLRPDARLFACDINARAAHLAHSNARDLKLDKVAVWNGDGLKSCRDACFDAILCNPPIRAGNRVIDSMFEGARRCLKQDGELWIVVRTSQGAKTWQKKLRASFGACETVDISVGYRILRAFFGTPKSESDAQETA
jgi:16S rRNA (guanine1207-N2)-methyltransferase